MNVNWYALHREIEKLGGKIIKMDGFDYIDEQFDFVVVRDYSWWYPHGRYIRGEILHLNYPCFKDAKKALLVGDIHSYMEARCGLINSSFDMVLAPYVANPLMDYIRLKCPETPIEKFPWWIDPEVFYPGDEERDIDVTMLGSIKPETVYPLRNLIHRSLYHRDDINYFYQPHPGYRYPTKGLWGKKYADMLRRSKVFLFGNSVYRYALFKYYEAVACGCFTMAPYPWTDAPFNLSITSMDFMKYLDEILSKWDETLYTRRTMAEDVHQQNSAEMRAQQLFKIAEESGRP